MAKRKSKTEVKDAVSGDIISRDAMFKDVVEDVQTKLLKKDVLVATDDSIIVLPVPAFIIRYLLQNTGLPLSCVYQVVGPEGCFKSTFAAEILRWHRLCGGYGHLAEAETKPTPEMRRAVLNYDSGAVRVEPCASLEDWQRKVTWITAAFQQRCLKTGGPGRTVPFCNIVDSLTGKASEHTLKNIAEAGHAQRHFATEAQLIADYMRAHPQQLLGWPITFVGVNHMKIQRDDNGMVDYNIPGGHSLKFQCAAIIEMEKMGRIKEYSTYKAANIRFHTIKNSYGQSNIRIMVRFKTWYQEDSPGVNRLHSRFEWWEAGIMFLATGQGFTQARAKIMVPQMREACDIHEKSAGSSGKTYWSKRLDVTSSDAMPAHDLGLRLEMRPDVLADLYQVLNITPCTYFKPGVDFLKQQEGYEYVAAQSDAVDVAVAALKALEDESVALGPTGVKYPHEVSPATEWPDASEETPEEA